ncbi:MAG: tetratricopeptide repeat protein [Desulfuromonadales bacterium]|nr:tetratricopeptide repeat protein [Desulfuromonadales bacterium]
MTKIGRNKPCPCGSGRKNKHCCGTGVSDRDFLPSSAEFFNEQGNSLADQGRFIDAILCYERALHINPDFAGAWNNLGITYKEQGLLDKAVFCYQRALTIEPAFAGACNNLGNALKELGRTEEAFACYRSALALVPDSVQVNTNLGNILYDLDRHYEAIPCLRRAVEDEADFSTLYKLAYSLRVTGSNSEAIICCQRALTLQPKSSAALINMGSAYNSQGRLNEAISCYGRAQSIDPDFSGTYCALLMTLQYAYSISSDELFATARQFAAKFEAPLQTVRNTEEQALQPGGKLKIGFVSADLHNHPVGYFLEGVLRHLNRDSLTLIAYANQTMKDSLSDRISSCFDEWVTVSGITDEQLAERIRLDGIDLLIDLSGHSNGNRLLTFARKPAPVQATWLGYANTTGLDAMDFILADPVTVPPGEEQFYTEKVWRLPETYVCFTPPAGDIPITGLPALHNGFITFGCFNYPAKLNDSVITCWSDILRDVPDSVLLMKYRNFDHETEREVFQQRFRKCGIDPARLRFAGASDREEYLAAYQEVDFCLDPFPFPGLTTTCEALWMGVPTLTLKMSRGMYGHNGELVMKSVGLDDWVAESIKDYRERARKLAADLEGLSALRSTLRQTLLASPLCAAERFAGNLEDAFRGMIRMSTAVESTLTTSGEPLQPHGLTGQDAA